MSPRPDPDRPASYQIQVQGHLDEHWSAWFGGLTITAYDDGTTTLTGVFTDQAGLHGALTKVRDLGLALVSVTRIPDIPGSRKQQAPSRPHEQE